MTGNRFEKTAAGMIGRLLAVVMLLTIAFGANAADCNAVWSATGAKPGSPTCFVVATNAQY
ncbi:hypothetical protein P3T18_006705 [Paraburkholderia sp. GAS199]